MSFLSPWGLLSLASVPALAWLWRLASARRRVPVPSLIPFERLLAKPPRRRGHLVTNTLFWLQLAALAGLSLALARPELLGRRAQITLVVLDTSASMAARIGPSSAFAQAQHTLLAQLSRKPWREQWFVMATSPVAPVTPQPTSDPAALARAIETAQVAHLGGNLTTAARVGRALLPIESSGTIVVTDEPTPSGQTAGAVRWITLGKPASNVAIVGADAQGTLCRPLEARATATIQNFSDTPAAVTVAVAQGSRRLAAVSDTIPPRARRSLTLALPAETSGWVELALLAPDDHLPIDNRAWLKIRSAGTVPVAIRSQRLAFTQTISRWLEACPAVIWTTAQPADGDAVIIADRTEEAARSAAALVFLPPLKPGPVLSHWVAAPDHPVGSYLEPIAAVAAPLNLSEDAEPPGRAVVSALVNGRSVPIVTADERENRRLVSMRLDPVDSHDPTPVLLVFFNSLRWLTGRSDAATTGVPLVVGGFHPGLVTVHRPDGSTDVAEAGEGTLRYEAATLAGWYRCVQGRRKVVTAANFFDPVESNLLDRASTWRAAESAPAPAHAPRAQPRDAADHRERAAHPVANPLIAAALILLLVEWWFYSAKSRPPSTVHRPRSI